MTQSYSNFGGTGDRSRLFAMYSDMMSGQGRNYEQCFDGSSSGSGPFVVAATTPADQVYVRISCLSAPRIIDLIKWYKQTSSDGATFQWQGSNDGATWTDLGAPQTAALAINEFDLGGNTVAYVQYQMILQSVTGTLQDPNINEFEFSIDDVVTEGWFLNSVEQHSVSGTNTFSKAITVTKECVIILFAASEASTDRSITSVVDDQGSTWALRKAETGSGQQSGYVIREELWWAHVPAAGTYTVTGTYTGNFDDSSQVLAAFADLPDMDNPWKADAAFTVYNNATGTGVKIPPSTITFTGTPVDTLIVSAIATSTAAPPNEQLVGFVLDQASHNGGGSQWCYHHTGFGKEATTFTNTVGSSLIMVLDALDYNSAAPAPPGHQTSSYINIWSVGNRGARSGAGSGTVVAVNTTNYAGEFGTTWGQTVDGNLSSGPVVSFSPTADTSYVEWQFDRAIIVDGIAFIGGDQSDYGTWKAYGSNDGTTYDYLSDVSWNNVTGGSAGLFPNQNTTTGFISAITNTTAYDRYKFVYHSGTHGGGRYCYEALFSVVHSELDGGNRTADITVSTNMTENSSHAASLFIDESTRPYYNSATELFYTNPTASGTPSYIRFQFPRAVTMRDSVVLLNTNGDASVWGTWQWQRSDDGSTWTNEGSPFLSNDDGAGSPVVRDTTAYYPDPGGSTPAEYWQIVCTDGTHSHLYFQYEWIFNLLEEPDAGIVDGDAPGSTITVTMSIITPDGNASGALLTVTNSIIAGTATEIVTAPGSTITVTTSVAVSGSVHTKAIDGSRIFEFSPLPVPETVYQTVDYDHIWGRGNRNTNGLITTGLYGWDTVFAQGTDGFDDGFSVGLGNGPAAAGNTPGASWWFEFNVDRGVDLRGLMFLGDDVLEDYTTIYAIFGGLAPGALTPNPYSAGFDGFNRVQPSGALLPGANFDLHYQEVLFEPRVRVPYPHYEMILLDGPRTEARMCNELWLKVAHSNLDGGDRRPGHAALSRKVIFTYSADWLAGTTGGSVLPPEDAWFDGSWTQMASLTYALIGNASHAPDPVTTVGAWFQFVFPRPVNHRHLMFIAQNNGTEVNDSGGNPMHFGFWHWEYSLNTGASWTAVGDSWRFKADCANMIAPETGEFNLPAVGPSGVGATHWRMVLDQGPAFGTTLSPLHEIIFDLIDITGQAPPLEIAFSDDTDGVGAVATIGSPGTPYAVSLSDGSDDGITVVVTNIPNPVLTVAFTDEGTLDSWSDLYPSMVVQTTLVTTGR